MQADNNSEVIKEVKEQKSNGMNGIKKSG